MKKYLLVFFIFSHQVFALSVYDVCNSINDNGMRLECLTGSKNGYFEERPLRVCLSFNRDIDRRDCVEVITDKTYLKKETQSCMMENDLSLRFFCMMVMGELIDSSQTNLSKERQIYHMSSKAIEELKYGNPRITLRILEKLKEMTQPK